MLKEKPLLVRFGKQAQSACWVCYSPLFSDCKPNSKCIICNPSSSVYKTTRIPNSSSVRPPPPQKITKARQGVKTIEKIMKKTLTTNLILILSKTKFKEKIKKCEGNNLYNKILHKPNGHKNRIKKSKKNQQKKCYFSMICFYFWVISFNFSLSNAALRAPKVGAQRAPRLLVSLYFFLFFLQFFLFFFNFFFFQQFYYFPPTSSSLLLSSLFLAIFIFSSSFRFLIAASGKQRFRNFN